MSFSTFLSYLRALSPRIPPEHWWIIGLVSLSVSFFLLIRKGIPVYGAFVVGLTILLGLFLLDALAWKRVGEEVIRSTGIDLNAEFQRIVRGSVEERLLLLFNFLVFVPFGILVTYSMLSVMRWNSRRCLQFGLLIAFGLSFCIELTQLVFHVGVFELTDLALNTLGASTGACATLGLRRMISQIKATLRLRMS